MDNQIWNCTFRVWKYKSPPAGGSSILCRPHYRPHSLSKLVLLTFYWCLTVAVAKMVSFSRCST